MARCFAFWSFASIWPNGSPLRERNGKTLSPSAAFVATTLDVDCNTRPWPIGRRRRRRRRDLRRGSSLRTVVDASYEGIDDFDEDFAGSDRDSRFSASTLACTPSAEIRRFFQGCGVQHFVFVLPFRKFFFTTNTPMFSCC